MKRSMRSDGWTSVNGVANCSPRYIAIVTAVHGMILGSAHDLIAGNGWNTARLIVSQLAFVHGMTPKGSKQARAMPFAKTPRTRAGKEKRKR